MKYHCPRCGEVHEGLSIDDYMKLSMLEACLYQGPLPYHAGDVFSKPSPTYFDNEQLEQGE